VAHRPVPPLSPGDPRVEQAPRVARALVHGHDLVAAQPSEVVHGQLQRTVHGPVDPEPPGLEVDRRRDRLEMPANVECLVRGQVVAEVPPWRLQAGRSVVDDPHGRLAGKPGERVASARRRFRLPSARAADRQEGCPRRRRTQHPLPPCQIHAASRRRRILTWLTEGSVYCNQRPKTGLGPEQCRFVSFCPAFSRTWRPTGTTRRSTRCPIAGQPTSTTLSGNWTYWTGIVPLAGA